jgi:hypothetical protein
LEALRGEGVDALGVGTAQDSTAEASEFTETQVVDVEEHDVR